MSSPIFKLVIGAKRQVTIPATCMELLSLEEGGELLLEVGEDHATLTPAVSVPRESLPENLRIKFAARRGKKNSDIPLQELLSALRTKPGPDRRLQALAESKGQAEPAAAKKMKAAI